MENSEVLFMVLLYKSEKLPVRAPYDIEILGKKMWQWVSLCGDGFDIATAPCTNESDIIALIKPYIKNTHKVVVALYSDTPLITRDNILEILDYFNGRHLNVLKLKRGYVFDASYIKNCDSIIAPDNSLFDGEEFEPIDSLAKLNDVTNKLQQQIINFHMSNGVQILDKNTTYIDADVVIEKGCTIAPNNHIKGNTYLADNVTIEPNNIIVDSIISKNVIVRCSYISNSRIGENVIVGPFETIIDKNL